MQNTQKIKLPKTSLPTHSSCFTQKTAPKKSQYSKNETILKIAKNGHNPKAIVHGTNHKKNCRKNAKTSL